jgi:hypothetical protein
MQRRFKWLIVLVVAVCAIWTGGWFYAASFAEKAADKWLAQQASLGRTWACTEREIGGFPFRMAMRCKTLSFSGQGRSGRVQFSLANVRAIAQVYNPKFILAEADGPLEVSLPGRVKSVKASWSGARASLRVAKPVPERLSVHIDKLQAQVTSNLGDEEKIAAASAEFHLRPAPDVTADIGSTDVAILANQLTSSLANRLAGDDAPANAVISTRITRLPALLAGPPAARLERWRQAKGTLTLQNVKIDKGPLALDASGQLQLDDQHMLEGRINARAAGFRLVLRKLGVPGFSGASGALISGLLGQKAQAADSKKPQREAYMPLPLELRGGFVWLGPVKTGVRLKPLY